MLRFVLESYSFKRIVILTILFGILLFAAGKFFDKLWYSGSYIPIINLNDVYDPPKRYDNFTRVNLKITESGALAIEGNKKFRVIERNKQFDYIDTTNLSYPDSTFDKYNKIYLQFEENSGLDSIYFVTSKSHDPSIYYKQIFFSSVIVESLNEFSEDEAEFRINPINLETSDILQNNDTLINSVLSYFNENINTLGLAECGTNSRIFSEICDKFHLPVRILSLQGGNSDETGFEDNLGYPLHVVCEVYSSKYKKWYLIDPTFGFRFRNPGDSSYLSAVEISNRQTFRNVEDLHQDSILQTKRTLLGKDYFKFYENVIFTVPGLKNKYIRKGVSVFYSKFNYFLLLYSSNYPAVRNGFYYVGIKTFLYFLMLLVYVNLIMLLFIKRLFLVKKPE